MKNKFLNKPFANIYLKPSEKTEVVSQVLYGEKFEIIFQKKNWAKIKTNFDNYIGFIKTIKFKENFSPLRKIFKKKSRIFKKKKNKFLKTGNFLYFGSGIEIRDQSKNYLEFEKNKWIRKKDTKKIDHLERNFNKVLKMFKNCKYLWGGKTSNGLDCSALVQIYFYYNRVFFPRDTSDQIIFCKKKFNKKFSKGDIIFWKGHVGVCLDKSKFIHAYGPRKKVLIMPINQTIRLIEKTTGLKVKKIFSI